MAADLWVLMKQLHPPGATTQYCTPGGSSGNPGTTGSRTNLATAMSRIEAAGGGTIILGDGAYGNISWSADFSNNSWGIIKAENRFGATATNVGLTGGSYMGVWGIKTAGSGAFSGIDINTGHHLAVWCCWTGGHGAQGIGCAGNFGSANNFSVCYNICHENCRIFWGSGISFYETSNNVGQTDHNWIAGYDNIIVGNILWGNYTDPGGEGGQGDGNGLILDDNWNLQGGPQQGQHYAGNWLLLGNISLANGGTGLHNLSTDNVDYYFNTVANNGRARNGGYYVDASWEGNAGNSMDAVCGEYGGRVSNFNILGNIVREPAGGSGWFNRDTAVAPFSASNNVLISGIDTTGFNSRSRTSTGWNYFSANPPTLTPLLDTVNQWLPDGGGSGVEKTVVSGTLLSRLGTFPDALGIWRPNDGNWTIGALETVGGTGGTGGGGGGGGGGGTTPGTFSGTITHDELPMAGAVVKVVNAYHTNWTGNTITDVLNTLSGNGGDASQVKVTTTDANGHWSVSGLTPGMQYMLKIFPTGPSPLCIGNAIIDNPAYSSGQAGFINAAGDNFMSPPSAPANETYNVFGMGRYLFDMPTHVYPTAGNVVTLNGSNGYNDLNVRFFTRTGSFSTSNGTVTGCTALPGGDNSGNGGGGGGGGGTGVLPATVRIMTLGDSITQGTSYTYAYRLKLNQLLQTVAGHTYNFVGSSNDGQFDHEGHSGWLVDPDFLGAYVGWLSDNPSDLIIVNGGVNDLSSGHSVAAVEADMTAFVDGLFQELPEVYVVLTPIAHQAPGPDPDHVTYNNWMRNFVAQRNGQGQKIYFADTSVVTTGFADAVHPLQAGYEQFAQIIFDVVSPLLTGNGGGTGPDSILQNPSHTYGSPGVYTVSLTATNAHGSTTLTRSITIDSSGGGGTSVTLQAEDATQIGSAYPGDPYAMQIASTNAGFSGSGYIGFWGLAGENLSFSVSGLPAGSAEIVLRYQQCASDTPTTRTVYLNGSLVSTVNFSRTGTVWETGSWTDTNPISVTLTGGTDTIQVRYSGGDGGYTDLDRMVVTSTVITGDPPTAAFTRAPLGNQETGTLITFTDTSAHTPTSWNWTFGDGNISILQNPTHTYLVAGTYTVTLQAVNAFGNTTVSHPITITAPVAPLNPPVAAFTVSANLVSVGQVVTFVDHSTNSPFSWDWDFDDTTGSGLQNPTHAYSAAGTYGVVLTVTNGDGFDYVAHQIVVIDAPIIDPNDPLPVNRQTFNVITKRPISLSEEADLRRVLGRFKPLSALLRVSSLSELVYDDLPVRRVAADSEWWEVISEVVTRPGTEWAYAVPGDPTTPQEQPRPPFSAYQGEQWSYAGDIASITSYAELDGVLLEDYHQRVLFRDGTHFDYRSELGVRWPQDVITERLAIDGSLVSNPLAVEVVSGKTRYVDRVQEVRSRTDPSRSGVSPLYFNGVSIEDLALRSDSIFSPHRRQAGVPQRFWTTTERAKTDPMMESIEVRLRTGQRVNRFQFQLAHFPHEMWLEMWDPTQGDWRQLWTTKITDSVPSSLASRVDDQHHFHPQHSMNGHWLPFDLTLEPVVGARFRIRMQRLASGMAPLNSSNAESTYSLGVRGFDMGYVIRSRDDIPRLPASSPIGNSVDPLGSRVVYSLRERLARLAVDGDSETAWMSEPQPLAAAVVNFYVDMRDSAGDGRIVDRWYLDPIKPGPNLNVYYSNDTTPTDLVADDNPLGIREITAQGLFTALSDGMSMDSSDPSYFVVPNDLIQFDYSQNWWFGAELEPRFNSYQANSPIMSFDEFSLQFANQSIVFASPSGNDVVLFCSWHAHQVVRVFASFDAAARTITIGIKAGNQAPITVTETITHTMVGYAQGFRVAADPSLSIPPDYVLRSFVLNQSLVAPAPADYLANPESWVLKAPYRADDTGRTNGALLRMHHDFIDGEQYPFGIVGGPGDAFAYTRWTPIPRDFRLQKGWINLPPTKAKFWKFEFSSLVMEPIEVQTPMHRTVRVFPMTARFQPNDLREDATPDIPAYDTFAQQWQNYQDSPSPTPEPDPTKTQPTSLLYSVDPSGAQRLRASSWAYGFVPWHVGATQPRFVQEGLHVYDYVSFVHTEKIGFFVGLKEIKAGLSTFQGNDNPQAIIDRFYDASRLTSSSWSITPGNAWSGQSIGNPAVIESQVYPSRNRIKGLQFATQQTDAIQLIPDDEFRNPALGVTDWTNVNGWNRVGDANLTYAAIEQQVICYRAETGVLQIDPLDQGIDLPPVHPVFAMAKAATLAPGQIGGLASPFVQTSPNGMLHAAARITALTDLTNPLYVQILDKDGVVLVEEAITAKDGDTVEWTASYYLGEYGGQPNSYVPDFGNRTIVDHPVHPVFAGLDALVDNNPVIPGEPVVVGYLFQVRLVQKGGETNDIWAIDRLSLFDESIIWEFSVDGGSTYIPAFNLRNNPNGMLSFPRAGNALRYRVTAYRANIHVSAIQIRPLYSGLPTHRFTNMNRGPNLSVYDQFPPIQEDPEFKRWNKPVPQSWWLEGQATTSIVPIDGYPYSNEYSRKYIRFTISDLTAQTDTTTRIVTYNRFPEDVTSVTDGTAREMDYGRVGTENLSEQTDTTTITFIPHEEVAVDAGVAEVTAGAHGAVGGHDVAAEAISVTATANTASESVSPQAGSASASGTANAPTEAVEPQAGQASATGVANAPSEALKPQAGRADATGHGSDPTVNSP